MVFLLRKLASFPCNNISQMFAHESLFYFPIHLYFLRDLHTFTPIPLTVKIATHLLYSQRGSIYQSFFFKYKQRTRVIG